MTNKSKAIDNISKLERNLDRIQAAQRRKFLNEDILRLEKNGDISYERVRTVGIRRDGVVVDRDGMPVGREANHGLRDEHCQDPAIPRGAQPPPAENPANSNWLPNKLPDSPTSQENGNLIADSPAPQPPNAGHPSPPQIDVAVALTAAGVITAKAHLPSPDAGISCHEAQNLGNQPRGLGVPPAIQEIAPEATDCDPLQDLLHRALAASQVRRGRPPAFDDHAKGQLVALLSVGMSMRQAAAVLRVSHTTVQKILKSDPELKDDITAARFQAQLQPLACVIREARRSWKAATWLLKYLDAKIATHEETPDERRDRQHREADEFFGRSPAPGVKKRKVLG